MSHRRRPSLREQWETGLRRMQSLSRKSPSAPAATDGQSQPHIFRDAADREEVRKRQEDAAQQQEQLKEAAMAGLPEDYFEDEFEAPLFELQRLPPNFQVEDLDVVAEDRATVLEAVSERLSKHVLANYDVFVRGINEAASVESDLQAALDLVKSARARLATTATEVEANISIADRQRQRQGLSHMADILLKLQQVFALHSELKEAQEGGEYAACFWLCAQCCKSLETLQTLSVTGELLATVNRLYGDTIHRMGSALQSICCEFEETQYCKILEGYGFLGSTDSLGEEVNSAFASVIGASTLKVVRGIVLTRAGLEDKARSSTVLPEIVKWLPPDLFRQCLAKVLMVIFDILASHYRMHRWHEQRLAEHHAETSRLQELIARLDSAAADSAERDGHSGASMGEGPPSPPFAPLGASPPASENGGGWHSRRGSALALEDAVKAASISLGVSRALASGEAELDPLGDGHDREALTQRLQGEELWGATLLCVADSLGSRRKTIWDEAARKIGMLLAAPAAFQGEHFLQVLEWMQTMLRVGEAFSGSRATGLRDAIQRHSGRFFQAFHGANLQALHQMLDQELWKPLPTPAGRRPDFPAALRGSQGGEPIAEAASFPDWVAQGNPWKKQAPGPLADAEAPSNSELEASVEDRQAAVVDESHLTTPSSPVSTSGRAPVMTTSSWRMLRWMSDYAGLMRMLASDAGKIHSGCCELFELYFLHVFHVFGGISVGDLLGEGPLRQGGADAVPLRLRNAVLRVLNRSLPRLRGHYLPRQQGNGVTQADRAGGLAAGASPGQSGANDRAASQITALSNPGNMYGLLERKVAVDSLVAVAQQLLDAQGALGELLSGRRDVPDHHTLDSFFQTVKAASDLRDVVLRAAARLNLSIGWVPERLAEQNFDLEEPPTKHSPWVAVLLNHMRMFRQRLETAAGLSRPDVDLLWGFGVQFAAEVVLEGLARSGAKGRCTVMGRSAMSLDLQGLQQGLQGITGGATDAESLAAALRIVDAYIKAFYIPWGEELHRWALTHPEYTREQVMLLVSCIADANGLKRRDRNALVTEIETDLTGMR